MVNDRQDLDLSTFARGDDAHVEWLVSDSPVPYPQAIDFMEARAAGIAAGELAGVKLWPLAAQRPPGDPALLSQTSRTALMRRIAVTALPDGWKLTIDDIANDMVFRSGRAAERAARRLADRLARAGVWSEIRLHLKDGSLAARFVSPGRLPGPPRADRVGLATAA